MFVCRRTPRLCPQLLRVRRNATLHSDNSPDAPAPPQPLVTTPSPALSPAPRPVPTTDIPEEGEAPTDVNKKTKGRVWPTSRPSISLERPRQYSRPIGVGVLPAYDEALEYIKWDSKLRKEELKRYRMALDKAQNEPELDAAAVERLQEKVKILEIQSETNLPSVRWKARNGMADMSKTVYRHLLEQRWRQEGALDLLMERIHQMNVVPDLLPSLRPSLDLRVNFPERPPQNAYLRTRVKRKYEKVEPGVFLLPEQTWRQPMLYTTVFHSEPRLYTLLMFDLDVPDPENQSFTTYLHWMQPNLSLSASSPSPIPLSTAHTRYVPPHPQRGTPYHRYTIILVPQSHPSERISVPVPTEADRLGFNYRAFAEEYGLDASTGGGAYMWREVWDETVSKIYQDVLKTEEPSFARQPKADPYAEVKQSKKYV